MMAALSPVQAACGVRGARQVAGRSAAAAPVSGVVRVTARSSAFTGGSARLSNKTRGCVGRLSTGEMQKRCDEGGWKDPPLQEKNQQRVVIILSPAVSINHLGSFFFLFSFFYGA